MSAYHNVLKVFYLFINFLCFQKVFLFGRLPNSSCLMPNVTKIWYSFRSDSKEQFQRKCYKEKWIKMKITQKKASIIKFKFYAKTIFNIYNANCFLFLFFFYLLHCLYKIRGHLFISWTFKMRVFLENVIRGDVKMWKENVG